MVQVGFFWTRSALCALNMVHLMLGVLLIGVAVWRRSLALVASGNIVSAVIALAVLLLLISVLGLVGTLRHHQSLLFFYLIVLLLVFLLQLGVSCSCLAFSREHQEEVLSSSWKMMDSESRRDLEHRLDCCGLFNSTERRREFSRDAGLCTAVCKVKGVCFKCGDLILQDGAEALRFLGGVGLFFSFSQIVAVWLVLRYRNQREPQAGSDTF